MLGDTLVAARGEGGSYRRPSFSWQWLLSRLSAPRHRIGLDTKLPGIQASWCDEGVVIAPGPMSNWSVRWVKACALAPWAESVGCLVDAYGKGVAVAVACFAPSLILSPPLPFSMLPFTSASPSSLSCARRPDGRTAVDGCHGVHAPSHALFSPSISRRSCTPSTSVSWSPSFLR